MNGRAAVKHLCVVGVAAAVGFGAAAAPAVPAAAPRSARIGVLRFTYPQRFAHLLFPKGVLVASYGLSRNSPTVRSGIFRSDGVVFELFQEPKLEHPIAAPAVRFPLSLAKLGRSDRRPRGQTRELRFRVNGNVYWAIAFVGTTADNVERSALAAIVSSIRRG